MQRELPELPVQTEQPGPSLGGQGSVQRLDSSLSSRGWVPEDFGPYLLTIAEQEFPRLLRGKLGASDLVQETLLKGHQSLATFRGSTREEFAGWLRQILLNHLKNTVEAFQTRCRDVSLEEPVWDQAVAIAALTPSQSLLAREEQQRLETALSRLPELERQILLLHHRDDLSFAELGRTFSLSASGARLVWRRAVETLRRELNRGQGSHGME